MCNSKMTQNIKTQEDSPPLPTIDDELADFRGRGFSTFPTRIDFIPDMILGKQTRVIMRVEK